nr:peptidoglycan DD-metalloendopeptidase family protein [Chloroflexota bacterium]
MDYRTENGATLDYSYGSQPQAVTAVSGGQSFAYDASGQRVKTVQPDGRILYTPFPTYEEEVWPVAATTPIVTLTANGQTAVTIPPNTAYALQWQASNAFACEAGGSWSGSKPLNGSQNFKGFSSGSRTYSLTCSNVSGSTSRSVTVQIGYGFDLPLAVVIVPLDGPTSGQTTIQRSTYSLAGQAIAVRVAGSPLATNNGLFYLYSDHASALLSTSLGSASALVTSGGQKVNETRYLPFGGYRSGGPNAITDRGFTGQKENMELGLLYYQARFYAPGLGRFLSADSIVPNPTNPQSLNRYSYTRNSPLNLIDPTGHRDCEFDGNCGPPVRLPRQQPTLPPKNLITHLPIAKDTATGVDEIDWLGGFGANGFSQDPIDCCYGQSHNIHTGLDFGADVGTTVYATVSGTVYFGYDEYSGDAETNLVIKVVVGDAIFYVIHGHIDPKTFQEGQYIAAGTEIGTVAEYKDGASHVHLGV